MKISIAEEFALKPIGNGAYRSNKIDPQSVAKHYIQYRMSNYWTLLDIATASNFELPFGKTKWTKKLLTDACVEWLTK
tara:strand:+ start:341 stop:574 length:234 start_codon:yes stop_codon:yes gene_type:complete